MDATPFAVDVSTVDGPATLRMSGDLTGSAREVMDTAYTEVGGGSVVLDFRDVRYINSTGIAVIVGVLARARATGGSVRAFGLDEHYRKIFQITRIADFMAIYDDESAALAG